MDVVNYFYQDGKVLYTTGSDANKAFNILGAGDNIIATEHQDTNGNASYSFYNKDLRGSTTNILGSDLTSNVSYDYDWFGNTEISNPAGSDFYNQICYTGGMYDESTKQYYLNARFYDPEDGRFISQDTYRGNLRDASSWNLYAYCANNPVKYSDPSGHIIQVLFAVGFAAWAVYDGVKEYKKAKKAGKTGSKLALHMGGYIAKDIVIGKALKAFKVADRIKDVATKVYKSKVITKTFAAVKSKIQPRLPKLNISNTSKGGSGSKPLLDAPSGTNPWLNGSEIKSIVAPKDFKINMAMSQNQTLPGGWGTLDSIDDVNFVRNQLAVTPEFKANIAKVQQYLVPEGTRLQIGTAGSQIYKGVTYPGGGNQVQILNYLDRTKLIPVGDPIMIK